MQGEEIEEGWEKERGKKTKGGANGEGKGGNSVKHK